jgi:hypothetical protein
MSNKSGLEVVMTDPIVYDSNMCDSCLPRHALAADAMYPNTPSYQQRFSK